LPPDRQDNFEAEDLTEAGPGAIDRDVKEIALVLAEPVVPALPSAVPVPAPPGRRPRRWPVALAASVLLLAGLGAWYWWTSGTPVPQFKTVPVDRGPIRATVSATGTVNPVISVQVGSQVTGKIQALYADYNSVVKKGQVIAQIDPATFRARVNQARASLRNAEGSLLKAETALVQRQLELDRMEALRRDQFVSQADLDLARTNHRDAAAQLEVSRAGVDQAKAALASARLDLGYTTISSPVNGIVVSRNVDVGQTVAAALQAPVLFVIAQDLTRMQVNANVSESDIGGITEGKPAEFTVDAFPRDPFSGTVVQVRNAPISIQNVVTYDVVINVDNRALKLKPGMTANVSIVTAAKEGVLRVPSAALRFRMPGASSERKQPLLWRVDGTGQPQAVPVKTGIADAVHTEVAEGEVREGDRVIVAIETAEEGVPSTALPPGFSVKPPMR
jgi:HlyD family secretion protein